LRLGWLAGGDDRTGDNLTIAADHHLYAIALGRAFVFHTKSDCLLLADDTEARGRGEHDAAVTLTIAPGNDAVYGCRETQQRCVGHIVNAPIGDHDRARNAIGWNVGEGSAER